MKFKDYLSLKKVLSYSSINYIQSLISFAVTFFLAKKFGTEEFGKYTYGLVFANTVSVLVQYGMDKTLVRDLVQNKEPQQVFIAASLFKLMLSVLAFASVAIWLLLISKSDDELVLIALIGVTVGTFLGMSPKDWFDFSGKITTHALITLIEKVVFAVLSISLIFLFDQKSIALKIILLLLFSKVLISIFEWNFVRKTCQIKIDFLRKKLKHFLLSNSFVWFAAIGNLMMTQVNQLLLKSETSTRELGLYGFALQLIMLVRLFQAQILRLTKPMIADTVLNDTRTVKLKNWIKYTSFSLISTIVLVTVLYFLAPIIIRRFVNPEFLQSLPILNILIIWILIYGVALINNQYLISLHLQKMFFVITLVFGIVSLILSKYLIPIHGGVGAASSLLISHSCSILIQIVLVLKALRNDNALIKKNLIQQ